MRARAGEAGFTLIELLVVLAVLGLTASLVLTRGPARSPTLNVRAAASEVAQGLRLARAQAIASNRPVGFVIDVAAGGYRVGAAPPQALPRGLALSLTTITENTLVGNDSLGAISFLPDGSSSGGRVGIAAGATGVWVGVDWLTGRVSIVDAR